MEWEVQLIEWLQNSSGSFISVLGKIFSFMGGEHGLLLVSLIVLFCWKKESGKKLALVVLAVNVWAPMIKAVVMRLRPYMDYPDRVKALELVESDTEAMDIAAQGYSFPSTHSASAASLYLSLAGEVKKRWMWIVAVAITLMVGISRVAVGMHYPTDVMAGWAVGLAGIAILSFLNKLENEYIRYLILLLFALPGVFYVRTQDYFTSLGLLIGLIIEIPFEQKFVKFRDTRYVPAMILRTIFAFVIYFVLNTLLKLPFDRAFLDSGSIAAFLVRTARYAVIIFVIIGVYPKIFTLYEKIGKNRKDLEEE